MKKTSAILSVILALIIGVAIGNAYDSRAKLGMADKNDDMNGQAIHDTHTVSDGSDTDDDEMDMAEMMAHMNLQLEGKTGDEFDRAFLEEMIVHHEGAVDMARLALMNAKHQEIKDLAAAIIAAQNTEISQMQQWMKAWYGTE